jgi:GTP cyclohydrolase IA
MMKLVDWLKNVTTRQDALRWIDSDEGERRIVKAYKELLRGYEIETSALLKTTREVPQAHAGLITVRQMNYYSLCGHHFLPFFGKIDVMYEPGTKIIGLGKFPRLVQAYASRFQIQEDLVKDIAEEIMRSGGAKGVYVTSTGRHMCMCSRGPADDTVETVTSYGLGSLADKVFR